MYSIKFLCQSAKISQQTFYRLIRDNSEFRELVESNREKKGNSYRYGKPVLDWLIAHYEAETPAEALKCPVEPRENPTKENTATTEKADLEALQAEYDNLKSQYEKLKSDYDKLDAEKQTLLSYQGNLLFLLTQEKAEKQKLLVASSHQTIGEKLKSLFKRKQSPEGDTSGQ